MQLHGKSVRSVQMGRTEGGTKSALVAAIAVILALALLLPLSAGGRPAVADGSPSPTALSCSATSTLGTASFAQQLALQVSAPVQSLPSKTFSVTITDPGETLPATLQGDPVTSESNVNVVIPLPADATFVSATLSGGSNVGSGASVSAVADPSIAGLTDLVESVPGPIAAGATFSMPTVDLTLTASSNVGDVIRLGLMNVQPVAPSPLSGDAAFSATAQVTTPPGPTADVSETCWPASPIAGPLSTTTVVAVDTSPPAIGVFAPVNGAVYTVGQVVDAAYACTDVASYGVATCSGPVASGSAIDTSTPGEHGFNVTATDKYGTPALQSVSYYVKPAPTVNVIGPSDAGAVALTAGTSCSFGGAACPVAGAAEATYEVTAPVPDGGPLVMGDTFTVQWQVYEPGGTASSGAGGPQLAWTLPAPTNTVIDGPVTSSATGLVSPTLGAGSLAAAGACTDATCVGHSTLPGAMSVNGVTESGTGWTYNAVSQNSLALTWDDNSNPVAGTDGVYLDVSYTVEVTSPGTVTLPGFPAITGPAGLATAPVTPPDPGVSFSVADPIPPSATVTSPVNGEVYSFGQVVVASYTCADAVVAVTSCTGSVPVGAPIDTTSAARHNLHTMTVTATDAAGNTSSTEVEYYVNVTPPVANPATFSVAFNGLANLPVLKSATVTDYPLDPTTVSIVSPPADGTATPNPDGTVTYVDNQYLTFANWIKTGSLADSFTYSVKDTDGTLSNTTTVSLAIIPKLDVTTIPTLPTGLTLQQPQASPVDPLGDMSGSTCTGTALQLDGQAQEACGQLAPVTIISDGGSNAGWSLSGEVSDFLDPTAPSGTTCDTPAAYSDVCIPGGDLGWSPFASVLAVLPDSAAVVQPGQALASPSVAPPAPSFPSTGLPLLWELRPRVSAPGSSVSAPAGLHDQPQVLCQAPANASQGSFTCGAGLTLPVPASTAASSGSGFQATLTLTLTLS
jgi:dehydratase